MRILLTILVFIVSISVAHDNPGLKRLCELAAAGEFKQVKAAGLLIRGTTNQAVVTASLHLDRFVAACHDCDKLQICIIDHLLQIAQQGSAATVTLNIDFMPHRVFITSNNRLILDCTTKNNENAVLVVAIDEEKHYRYSRKIGFSLHDYSQGLVLKNQDGIYKAKIAETENGMAIIIQEPIDFYPSPIKTRKCDRVYIENDTEYFAILSNFKSTNVRYEIGRKCKIVNPSTNMMQERLRDWVRRHLEQLHVDLNITDLMMERILLLLARYPQTTDFPFGFVHEAVCAERPVHLGGSCYITTKTYRDIVRGASYNNKTPLHPLTKKELPTQVPAAIQNMHRHLIQTHGEAYSLNDIVVSDLISGEPFILDAEETQDIARCFTKRNLTPIELESIGGLHGYNLEKLKALIEQKLGAPQAEVANASVNSTNDVEIQTNSPATSATLGTQTSSDAKNQTDDCILM